MARLDGGPPRAINGNALDGEWRRLTFAKVGPGVGVDETSEYQQELAMVGLMSYEAAQALRWWFHTNRQFWPLQTRLVPHAVHYSVQCWRKDAVDVVPVDDRAAAL